MISSPSSLGLLPEQDLLQHREPLLSLCVSNPVQMQFPTAQRIRIAGDRLLVCDCRAHIAEEWRILSSPGTMKLNYSFSEPSAQVFLSFLELLRSLKPIVYFGPT